jgi:hypothetical protein
MMRSLALKECHWLTIHFSGAKIRQLSRTEKRFLKINADFIGNLSVESRPWPE